MKYSKPELVALGNAATEVKGAGKPGCFTDGHSATCSAYEADE